MLVSNDPAEVIITTPYGLERTHSDCGDKPAVYTNEVCDDDLNGGVAGHSQAKSDPKGCEEETRIIEGNKWSFASAMGGWRRLSRLVLSGARHVKKGAIQTQ